MKIICLAEKEKIHFSWILKAMTYAFVFWAVDEKGNQSKQDLLFDQYKATLVGILN